MGNHDWQTHDEWGRPIDTGYNYRDDPRGSRALPIAIAIVATILVILVGFGAYLLFWPTSNQQTSTLQTSQQQPESMTTRSTTTETSTSYETESESSSRSSESSTSPSESTRSTTTSSEETDKPVDYGAGLRLTSACGGGGAAKWVGTGSAVTSCGFAQSVGDQLAGQETGLGARNTVTAKSPVTGQDYQMRCTGVVDDNDVPVWKCRGGDNAVVFVYP